MGLRYMNVIVFGTYKVYNTSIDIIVFSQASFNKWFMRSLEENYEINIYSLYSHCFKVYYFKDCV